MVIDRDINRIATLRELEGRSYEKTIRFDDLSVRDQQILVKRILEVEYGLDTYNLSKKLRKIRGEKDLNGLFRISPDVETRVLKDGKSFYLAVHIRHEVVSQKTIWELVERDSSKLKELLVSNPDVMLRNLASKYKNVWRPLKIRDDINEKEIERLYDYHTKYFPKEELKRKFGEPDYSQPIIVAKSARRRIKYEEPSHLLPQFSAIVYNAHYLEESEAKEFLEYVRLSPNERLELLYELLNMVETDVISKNLAIIETESVKEATIVVRGFKGGLKPLTAIERKSIFRWIRTKSGQERDIFLPFEVPEIIQNLNEIPTVIVADKNAKIGENVVRRNLLSIISYINILRKHGVKLPFFNYARKIKFKEWDLCNDRDFGDFLNFVKDFKNNISFTFIVLIPDERFDRIKRRLLELNVISQVINDSTFPLDTAKKNCILLQVLSKLGIKYYVLQRPFEYDYVVGLDITPTKTGKSYIAGCAVMIDSQGYIRRTIPIELEDQSGEKVDAKEMFEKMVNLMERKYDMPITGKKMLFLKDGKFYPSEVEALNEVISNYDIDLTIMNIEKRHGFRFLSKNSPLLRKIYTKIGSDVYLLPHTLPFAKGTPIPIKLSGKKITVNGKLTETEIIKRDVEEVYCLTAVNYATLYGMMKLPAPVHYAHQFVNALRRGWKVFNEDFLREGLLYFI